MDKDVAIQINNVKKQYRLGQIGGGTLQGDLQSWWARKRGKEDPNAKIGSKTRIVGQKFWALNGISLTVKKGEALGIIGRNGAGKSTLLKLLSRVTAPTEGSIDIAGRITSMLEVGTGFHPEMTGRENVYLNGAILGMSRSEIDSKMNEIIEFSEVGEFIDTPVKRYSSGMYVKLAFSVAAHLESEIMIMDEVLAVGDMKFQQKCLKKMKEAAQKEGKTVLYVSHNMNTIRQLCDRCIVLDSGQIVFDGEVEEAINNYLGIRRTETNIIESTPEMHELGINETEVIIERIVSSAKSNAICFGENISFTISCKNKKEQEYELYFRLMLKNTEGMVVTMSSTEKPFLIKPKGTIEKHFEMEVNNIVPGTYFLSFVLYEVGQYGADRNIDIMRDIYSFTILVTPGFNHDMPWSTHYWGYVTNGYLKEIA